MKFIDFFSGIGGFRRGMELAGHECVGFCEFDKFAVAGYTAMHLMTEQEREYISTLPKNKRVAEAGKEEYRHGEWYANDIRRIFAEDIPKTDCWCFGFPCQDISVAGKQLGFNGARSSLFFRVIRLVQDLEEKDRPTYLFIENVKNLLSVNGGTDFLKLLIALDESGYDAEWQVVNSADYVPQNRERVFIIGHLRGRSTAKVFPIEGADRENSVQIKQIGNIKSVKRDNPNRYRVYDVDGISPTLSKMDGGGLSPYIPIPVFCDMSKSAGIQTYDKAFCLQARYHKGIYNRRKETSGICVPVLTPDRAEKRQNGRRMKENGEPMFTLTGQDRHGVMISTPDGMAFYAVWCEKYQCYIAIRKLTPRECFRLQGWSDEYFDRAELVNSDSQLYKQAGNGVTVPVIYEIAKRMRANGNISARIVWWDRNGK
jgi:DNA (cytosine-5)-methyltransferase 1